MFSTWDVRVSKDFTGTIARAGGEEISPQDQFDTRPIRKPCSNKISIEVACRGTAAVLQNLKTCKVSVLNDSVESSLWYSAIQAVVVGKSRLRFQNRAVCKNVYIQWRTAVSQSNHSYFHASLLVKICWTMYLLYCLQVLFAKSKLVL